MAKVTTSFKNWNFNDQNVQQNLVGGDFIGSHTILLCATAPRMANLSVGPDTGAGAGFGALGAAGGMGIPGIGSIFRGHRTEVSADRMSPAFAIPLGVVADVNVQQQRQVNKIYEIGSKLSYTVSARTHIGLSLNRILYHGPNLLRMLYAYYPETLIGGSGNSLRDTPSDPDSAIGQIGLDGGFQRKLPNIKELPGHDNIFINAASDLFAQPLGIVMYIKDNIERDVAAIFLEDCNVSIYSFNVTQGAVVIAENVQMSADKIRPIKVNVQRRLR